MPHQKLIKSGVVLIDPDISALLRIVALEYNADTLSRTLQVQAKPRAADAGVKWFYLSKNQNQAKHPGFRNRTRA